MTVGGNLINYVGNVATKTADLTTVKILINKTISDPKQRAAAINIKDFYLNNDLPEKEYIRIPVSIIPDDIYKQYNLHLFEHNGYVLAGVSKGMYGLPQAGRVASNVLIPRLKDDGYVPTGRTPGLFKHQTNSVYFSLIVDDFFVSYSGNADLQHLQNTLRKHYQITTDDSATKFCGMTLTWNYDEGYANVAMPGYIKKALQRFMHPKPTRA